MTPDPSPNQEPSIAPEDFTAELGLYGDALNAATGRADTRRRRTRRAVGAAGAACAIGLGALGALVAIPGASRLDPVAEARAALGTGGELLHYRVTFSNDFGRLLGEEREVQESPPQEVWTTTTGPVRWRLILPGGAEGCGVQGSQEISYVSPSERVYADGVSRAYSPWSKLIIETQVPQTGEGEGQSPFGFILPRELGNDRDPTTILRRSLDRGLLRDAGLQTRDGRQVRLLKGEVGEHRMVPDGSYSVNQRTGKHKRLHPGRMIEQRPTRLTYVVDAATFAPIELSTSAYAQSPVGRSRSRGARPGDRLKYAWVDFTVRFRTFERVDATPETKRQLELHAPADTKVFEQPTGSFDQLAKKLNTASLEEADADAERCRKATR